MCIGKRSKKKNQTGVNRGHLCLGGLVKGFPAFIMFFTNTTAGRVRGK